MAITKQEAIEILQSDDLVGIGMAAHQLRLKKNDPRVATYQIDRNINYTNFCTEYCSFCAFYRPLGAKDGYILSFETIYQKIDEMLELGGTGILLQGGLHPDLQIGYYENLLRSLKSRYPQVHLHCFSAPEVLCIAEVSELSLRDTIQRLKDAGLDSIPGGGAEILDDEIRGKIARLKCTSDEWEQVHRIAHSLGLRTTATMMFGCGEELRHRVNHLDRIRRIQEDTGGFTAFIPWIFAAEMRAEPAAPWRGGGRRPEVRCRCLACLGWTRLGHPRHVLYLRSEVRPQAVGPGPHATASRGTAAR